MKFRRAPRAARRGRKFRARPTSHDGLDVIAGYGNFAGWTRDGRVAGRVGKRLIECADGYQVSVIAGERTFCTPKPNYEVPVDYRGPYTHVEIKAFSVSRLPEFDPDPEDECGYVPVPVVRALIDLHGGFRRMTGFGDDMRKMREGAEIRARIAAETERAYPSAKW